MKAIKRSTLFRAPFAGDAAPFNPWKSITAWATDCGNKGVQVPSWDGQPFDLDRAGIDRAANRRMPGLE